MVSLGKWIAKHKYLILLIGFLLLIPSFYGMIKTRTNYDILSYLPDTLETVKGQDIMVDEFGMGAFSMVVVEGMELKDVQKLEDQFSEVEHVKDVLWYDDVADISLPVDMIPKDLREAFFRGDATMMLVLFDNTTSSDEAMGAVEEMRKLVNDQTFISGMSRYRYRYQKYRTGGTSGLCCDRSSALFSDFAADDGFISRSGLLPA